MPIESILTILSFVADKVACKMIEMGVETAWSGIGGDDARRGFRRALEAAVQRYATGKRLALVRALTEGGLLSDPEVIEELAHIADAGRRPNIDLIARKWKTALLALPRKADLTELWKAALNDLAAGWDFSAEAAALLGYLAAELRQTKEFQPFFSAGDLREVASSTAAVEARITELNELLNTKLSELAELFGSATAPVRSEIVDFLPLIQEKTRDFVGRQFVFDAISRFSRENRRGYFLIRGEPGIGKTALIAQMVKHSGYLHHFSVRAEGVRRADRFLKNVCAQLIAACGLPYRSLPAESQADSTFLSRLLGEAASRLGPGEKIFVLVDALDEADAPADKGANLLYLPVTVPERVYIVMTARRQSLDLRIDCEFGQLEIADGSAENLGDIRAYLAAKADSEKLREYRRRSGLPLPQFLTRLEEKSQGNFMYLRYVLPEMERGAYENLDIRELPLGLVNYYEDHWRRLRETDREAWFEYKLPVIAALTVSERPVSVDLLAKLAQVERRARVQAVIDDLRQFLNEEWVQDSEGLTKRYRWYHTSFSDFIAAKDQVSAERLDLAKAARSIGNRYWDSLYGAT